MRCEVVVDQPLVWIDEGAWEWRFPTVVGPPYLGEPGRTPDAKRVAVDVADKPLPAKMSLSLRVVDPLREGGAVESVTHPVSAERHGAETGVTLDEARLDRDVVVRWPVSEPALGVSLHAARTAEGEAYGLLTVVPPTPTEGQAALPRDLIVLIDTSGSMGGRPLDQARRVVSALIDSLDTTDSLELIEFSSRPSRFRPEAVVATREGKQAALKWVRGLMAGGCTEMRQAVLEALGPLREEIRVTGKSPTGAYDQRVSAPALRCAEGPQAVAALFGREWVEDLEGLAAGRPRGARDIDEQIEAVGLRFQIATRMTSWVAVGEVIDTSTELGHETMPHEIPYGVSLDGVGLRAPAAATKTVAGAMAPPAGLPRARRMPLPEPLEAGDDVEERTLELADPPLFDDEGAAAGFDDILDTGAEIVALDADRDASSEVELEDGEAAPLPPKAKPEQAGAPR